MITPTDNEKQFFADISALLQAARNTACRAVNSVMVETYWKIGRRIVEQEQRGMERANYGEYLIERLSRHLGDAFGKGFSEANLRNFRQFYLVIPDFERFATQCVANLSWTNIRQIIRLDDAKARNYYLQEAAEQNWSSRVLERNIKTRYYQRLLSTQKPALPATMDNHSENLLKDPYVLEFLGLPENIEGKESRLESAVITHLQEFLLEMGRGFSFVGRQFRISTETAHFFIDLVFYNYLLKCFVIIDLKTQKLTHQDIRTNYRA
jgi:predicted nuclease of restriction endonuclease-like (RecB) superfamily